MPGSPGRDKRGRDTKVSLPLLTPQPFLRTRLPSVARLKTRSPQGRLVPQGTTLDRSEAFRSDGVRALHRMAAHCHARRFTQSKFRALQRPKICPTHGTELPFLPFRRATAGSRGAKEGLGESRGGKGTIWCPCPLLSPPPDGGNAHAMSWRISPVPGGPVSPAAASRRNGGTASPLLREKREIAFPCIL